VLVDRGRLVRGGAVPATPPSLQRRHAVSRWFGAGIGPGMQLSPSTRAAPPRPPELHRAGRARGGRHPRPLELLALALLGYVGLTAVFTLLGLAVTGPLDASVGDLDRRVAERFADGRTPAADTWSYWGSMLAETGVKIVATALVVVVLVWVWRRWDDAALVAGALILEASVFITVTFVVGRPRPDVVRLDDSPVDSSFPSGHVAAAVVYAAVVVVIARHTTKRWPVVVSSSVVAAIALTVAWARMYRGMHHLSDVVAGALLGVASLAVAVWIARAARRTEVAT
jgi:undecaprenyl-diphosphatase